MASLPWPGVVAVSGGGDSVALMLLLQDWAAQAKLAPPIVAVVDHRLRDGSRREARQVADWARAAGLEVAILTRTGPMPSGDIEAFAREARYRLLGNYARHCRCAAVYAGHTEDDQAETFLLRLARGSGVDGLSAMRTLSPYPLAGFAHVQLVRPLLHCARGEVRDWLVAADQPWLDDPMNEDDRFARVRIRKSWPLLDGIGLSKSRLIATAQSLARARAALEAVAEDLRKRAVRRCMEGLLIDPGALAAAPDEIALRVLAGVLSEVSGQAYRPRFERLMRLYTAIRGGQLRGGRTLHGCRIATAPRKYAGETKGWLMVRRETGRIISKLS